MTDFDRWLTTQPDEDEVEDDRFQDDYNVWEENEIFHERELEVADPYEYDADNDVESGRWD
jgi:hypothetical protein